MSEESISQAPRAPVEIIRNIFELVAFESPKERPTLCLVSKTCQSWISPIIYHTIILSKLSTCYKFRHAIDMFSKCDIRTSLLATHTKVLKIPLSNVPGAILDVILAALVACSNLTTFSCDVSLLEEKLDVSQDQKPPLSHLNLRNLIEHFEVLPSRFKLTHISLTVTTKKYLGIGHWSILFESCPHLTHVAMVTEGIQSARDAGNTFVFEPIVDSLYELRQALPSTILQVVMVIFIQLEWSFGSPLHHNIRRDLLVMARRDTRFVWMVLNARNLLCDPYAPSRSQGVLAEESKLAGITGREYLEGDQEDIWTLAERVAEHRVVDGDVQN